MGMGVSVSVSVSVSVNVGVVVGVGHDCGCECGYERGRRQHRCPKILQLPSSQRGVVHKDVVNDAVQAGPGIGPIATDPQRRTPGTFW